MKTAQTKRNRIVSYLRFTASSAFFAAAAAFTVVAATTNVLTSPNDSAALAPNSAALKATAQDSVSGAASERSEKDGSLGTANAAAIEEYSKRAYPAIGISLDQTMNAIIGVRRAMATSGSAATPTPAPGKGKPTKKTAMKSKKSPPEAPRFNTWSFIGPNTAPFPSILTFSGASTVTSGRITALALDTASGCTAGFCRLWVGAAGGGVWRTTNALAATPTWTFLTSMNFSTNAIGSLTYVPSNCIPACGGPFNPSFPDGILYAGTGEPNASADSEAGLGIFKSTNGGDTWTQLPSQFGPEDTHSPGSAGAFPNNGTYSGNAFFGRAISDIVVDPTNFSIIYVSSARGVRGVDSTYGGPTSNPPAPRPPFGLFKSTDGGQHFSFIWDGGNGCPGNCNGSNALASIRGVHDLALDPSNNSIVYAATFPGLGGGGGVWRSNDSGVTWTQIKTALNSGDNDDRCSFSVTTLPSGDTRMYVGCGNDGANTAQVYRSDLVQTGAPAFTNLTAIEVAPSTSGYCGNACWYDNVIYTPPGSPDIVYVAGNYTYNECAHGSDCRGVVFATDAGATGAFWSDATWDAQNSGPNPGSCCQPNAVTPNQMHPDHHFIVAVPGNPFLFFDGSDGGLVRTNGTLSDISGQCASRTYPAGTGTLGQCQLLLGIGCAPTQCGVPTLITSLNAGLATLQFMSLSVAADNPLHAQGGTQDNGTFETFGSFTWPQEIYGDGGQSGFSVINSNLRFNTFSGNAHDGNFQNGNPAKWVILSGPIFVSEPSNFYPPIIADPHPAAGTTIFEGSRHVWRTQDWGGSQAFLETNCPEFTSSAANPACGDFVPLGGAAGVNNNAGDLEGTFFGTSRAGGVVNVIERTTADTSTAWAASIAGRVFISTNVDGAAGGVIWNRLDGAGGGTALHSPTRVVTGVAINPANTFQAWVSYSGYSAVTPGQPGHIFLVSWTGAGLATFTDISNNLPDIPLTSVVFDPVKGDLYASSDFIVFRLASGHTVWDIAGIGMPLVEVPKLTIRPSPADPSTAFLYAATHGLSAWRLPLYRP
jgi:hypothetical protein